MTQKQAVFEAIMRAFYNHKIDFQSNDVAKDKISSAIKVDIIEDVISMIENGSVNVSDDFKIKYHDRHLIRDYVKSLLSHSLKKDIRLNGGVKYESIKSIKIDKKEDDSVLS